MAVSVDRQLLTVNGTTTEASPGPPPVHRCRQAPPGIRVVQVTEATRDALPEQLMDRLIGAPRGEEQ